MDFIFLIIGSALSVLFIITMIMGQSYDDMLEPLPDKDFPLKAIYSSGLVLQSLPIFNLKGRRKEKLKSESKLFYSEKYSEYYSRIVWAQILSFTLLILSVTFVFAGFDKQFSLFFVIVGVVASAIFAFYFYQSIDQKIKTRKEECEREFPNAISKLALMVNSGVILHDAWSFVAYGKEGVFYSLMRESCEQMKNGKTEKDAIREFGIKTNSDNVKKFTSSLIQSIDLGGGDLPIFLSNQTREIWQERKQIMLQKGEKAASALLMPIVMLFAGIMLIVIAAALQSFSL